MVQIIKVNSAGGANYQKILLPIDIDRTVFDPYPTNLDTICSSQNACLIVISGFFPILLQSQHNRPLLSHLPIETSLESLKAELAAGGIKVLQYFTMNTGHPTKFSIGLIIIQRFPLYNIMLVVPNFSVVFALCILVWHGCG